MIGPVADLLRLHYVEGPDGMLVAGSEIAAGPDGGRVIVNLLAEGPYLLAFDRGLEVSIDGEPSVRAGARSRPDRTR
jgi:hypothetical protein